MKKIIKDSAILFVITLIAGLLLGVVYKITKEPIAEQKDKQKLEAYNKVFDKMNSYELVEDLDNAQKSVENMGSVIVNEVVKAYDSSKKKLGYIITVTDNGGYGGDIRMTVGIDTDGRITGLEILEINETAGLGMKAKEEDFRKQFVGIKAESITYSKTGKSADNEIDAISAATITTKAVTRGVNGALEVYRVMGGAGNE